MKGVYVGRGCPVNDTTVIELISTPRIPFQSECNEVETEAVVDSLLGGIVPSNVTSSFTSRFYLDSDGKCPGVPRGSAKAITESLLKTGIYDRPHRDSHLVRPDSDQDDGPLNFDEWCCQYLEGMDNE